MAHEDMRIRILGDAASATNAFQQVEKVATHAAEKITESFRHAGNIIKTSIGVVGIGVGIERSLEAASHLTNLQKVQAQLITNQAEAEKKLVSLRQYNLEGGKHQVFWRSKYLDTMATELSLQNGINKSQVVQAQTQALTNTDLLKFYKEGGKYLKGHSDLQKLTLENAANLSEVMGGGGGGSIVSSMRMLTRIMADPTKSMSTMRRMGIQLSIDEQKRIKSLQTTKGLVAAQAEFMKDINKHYKGIAATAQGPMELLKNQVQLLYTAFGQGLLPILDSLATAMSGPVMSFLPILQEMATAIKEVAESFGSSLGRIFNDLLPLFQLLSNAVVPALLEVVTPFVHLIEKAATPISKAFAELVGTSDKLGPLSQALIDIGKAVGESLGPAIDGVAKAFEEMAKGGKNSPLNQMMTSLVEAIKNIAPILPALTGAFTQFLIAITPIITASGPAFANMLNIFSKILVAVAPILEGVGTGISKLAGPIKALATPIAALLAVWFTKKLFVTPFMAIGDAIMGMTTKIFGIGRSLKAGGGAFGNFFSNIKSGMSATEAVLVAKIDRATARAELLNRSAATASLFPGGAGRAERYSTRAGALEASAVANQKRLDAIRGAGGGMKGLVKTASGASLVAFTPEVDALHKNTAALVGLTTVMERSVAGTALTAGVAGPGGSPAVKKAMSIEERLAGSMKAGRFDTIAAERKYIVAKYGANSAAMLNQFDEAVKRAKVMLDAEQKTANALASASQDVKKLGLFSRIKATMPSMGPVGFGTKLRGLAGGAGIGLGIAQAAGVIPAAGKGVGGAIGSVAQGAGMGAMFGPWGAGIGAAVGAIKALYDNFKPFHDLVNKTLNSIVKKVTPYVKDFAKQFKKAFHDALPFLKIVGKILEFIVVRNFQYVAVILKGMMGLFRQLAKVGHDVAHAIVTAFVRVANAIIHIINGFIHAKNFFNGILGAVGITDGGKQQTLTTYEVPKFHTGGIVPGPRGKEVPAVLQAGEAVLSLNQMRNMGKGGNHLNVASGAVNIVVNGNADKASTEEIKRHVENEFKKLHHTLRGMGR